MLYDKDIREPLFDFLEGYYGKIRILEEKQMGRSRADIVMVLPSSVVGIEIKSDADTYSRLQRQVRDYDQYFDYNYVVVGSTHAMHIEEHVPEWWGIITVEQIEGEADFYILRKPKENPKVSWKKKISLLWRAGAGAYPGNESAAEVQAEEQAVCDRENFARSSPGGLAGADQSGIV